MKKFPFLTCFFCLISVLAAFLFCCLFVSSFYNTFGEIVLPIYFIGTFVFCCVVHDYVCLHVVCSYRKKNNITDGCYFWNCPHYSVCPYNSNK